MPLSHCDTWIFDRQWAYSVQRVPDCLGGLSRVGISSRSTRPWNGQPPSLINTWRMVLHLFFDNRHNGEQSIEIEIVGMIVMRARDRLAEKRALKKIYSSSNLSAVYCIWQDHHTPFWPCRSPLAPRPALAVDPVPHHQTGRTGGDCLFCTRPRPSSSYRLLSVTTRLNLVCLDEYQRSKKANETDRVLRLWCHMRTITHHFVTMRT